jgi:hypothetical protein
VSGATAAPPAAPYDPGMRGFGGIALVAGLGFLSATAAARPVGERRVGVGIGVGEPTAITGYVSLSQRLAVDAAFGVVGPAERDLTGHADLLLFLAGDAPAERSSFALYLGAGGFVIDFYGNLFGGLRLPFGASVLVPSARLGFFAEVSMQLLLFEPYDTPRGVDLQAAAGVRFFF